MLSLWYLEAFAPDSFKSKIFFSRDYPDLSKSLETLIRGMSQIASQSALTLRGGIPNSCHIKKEIPNQILQDTWGTMTSYLRNDVIVNPILQRPSWYLTFI